MPESVYYFCDESSFATGPVMAVGGIAVPQRHLSSIASDIREINEAFGERCEVKWTSTRIPTLPIRMAYVDYLVTLMRENRGHFHIRFAAFDRYDHNGPRRRFDTTSKMHYQLLLHRAVRFYGPHYDLHIRPDGGECTAHLHRYITPLVVDGQRRYQSRPRCVASLQCRDSKKEPLLQLLDVSLGALTAHRIGRHETEDMATAKRELAKYAFATFGSPNLRGNTGTDEKRFSIWNAVPRGPRR